MTDVSKQINKLIFGIKGLMGELLTVHTIKTPSCQDVLEAHELCFIDLKAQRFIPALKFPD